MAGTWPKVILDPIHELIPFEDNDCDRLILDLINSREFQRLRRIKQLGMSELVFPGTNHSRFSHSIGVMHVARTILDRAEVVLNVKFAPEQRMAATAAALLHDIGHGPFSHAFEKVTKQKHEKRTVQIIKDPQTSVNKLLAQRDASLPAKVAMFIEPTPEVAWREQGLPPFFARIVSSQLDGDRLDYLLRDSFAAGTTYGRYDLRWLLLHLRVDPDHRLIFLGRKALSAVETYVFARHHMYKSVYFHKTTRSAEVMLRLALERYSGLLAAADTPAARQAIVPDAPPAVLTAFTGETDLATFLDLDDYAVTEFLKRCRTSADSILKEIGPGVADRAIFKALDATGVEADVLSTFLEKAKDIVRAEGYDPAFYLVSDRAADISYKPYNPVANEEITQIFIEDEAGTPRELSQQSEAVETLTKKSTLLRYYFPGKTRDKIEAVFRETIGR